MKQNQLNWNYGKTIEIDNIEKTENVIGIKFPLSYRDMILRFDGASLTLKIGDTERYAKIEIENIGRTTVTLKRHKPLNELFNSEMINDFKDSRDVLPNGFVPFANDSGGNEFIFDFSDDKNQPKIYFLHHEESISMDELDEEDLEIMTLEDHQKGVLVYIASSFEEFLKKIEARTVV